MNTSHSSRARSLAAVMVVLAMVAGACSSTHKAASGGGTGTTNASSGPRYSVMVGNTLSGPQASQAQAESMPAFGAAFAGTNVKVIPCDDKGTAAGNLICQHQAIEDHVAVFIATHQVDESVANSAGIPVVGVTDATTPVSFEVSGAPALFVGMAVALWNKGCRKLGFIATQGAQIYETQIQKSEPWQSVTTAYIPIAAPDVSAPVAKLSGAGVQCIGVVSLPSQMVQIVTAVHQANLSVPVIVPGIVVTGQMIQTLGSLGNGLLEVVSSPDPTYPTPAITAATKRIKAYDPSTTVTQSELLGYAFCEIVMDAAAKVSGPVTASSMLTALNGLRNADTGGIIPTISMIPRASANDRRDFDTNIETYVLQGGRVTQPSGWFDVGSQLDTAVG